MSKSRSRKTRSRQKRIGAGQQSGLQPAAENATVDADEVAAENENLEQPSEAGEAAEQVDSADAAEPTADADAAAESPAPVTGGKRGGHRRAGSPAGAPKIAHEAETAQADADVEGPVVLGTPAAAEPEVEPDADAEVGAEAETESEVGAASEPLVLGTPAAAAEVDAEPKPHANQEPVVLGTPATKSASDSEPEPEPDADAESGNISDTETEAEREAAPAADSEPEAHPLPESETQPKPGILPEDNSHDESTAASPDTAALSTASATAGGIGAAAATAAAVPEPEPAAAPAQPSTRRERLDAEGTRARGRSRADTEDLAHDVDPEAPAEAEESTEHAPRQGSSKHHPLRWVGRVLLLALVALIVVSIGAVVVSNSKQQPALDATASARAEALSESTQLLSGLNQAKSAASGNTALQPALAGAIATLQAGIDGLRPGTQSAAPSPQASAGSDPAALVGQLSDQAQKNLEHAKSVDPGLARLLASLAAGEMWQSVNLASATGISSPALAMLNQARTQSPDAAVGTSNLAPISGAATSASSTSSASASPTACSALSTAKPTDGKPDAAAALAQTAVTEQKAVYTYIAALPKLNGTSAYQSAVAQLASHQSALLTVESQLKDLCLQPPLREPGFDLGNQFIVDPQTYLGTVEQDAAAEYSTVIGLSNSLPDPQYHQHQDIRDLAINGLLRSVANAQQLGATAPPLPGYQG